MRHRIHVPALEDALTITGDEFHHAVRVARVRQGEEVELFDDAGRVARAKVRTIERDAAVIEIVEEIASREAALDIHLAMSVIQLEKFELVLQKATELGVRSITPLVTAHVEVRSERYAGKRDRWEKILLEAVKQTYAVTPRGSTVRARVFTGGGIPAPASSAIGGPDLERR